MNFSKRDIKNRVAYMMLMALAIGEWSHDAEVVRESHEDLPQIQSVEQMDHALEVISLARASLILDVDSRHDQRKFLLNVITRSLSETQRPQAFKIASSVIIEANRHGLDPFFLLAVITHESRFDIEAKGSAGEIGLMQILPSTAQWIATKTKLPLPTNLEEPSVNIRIGAAYLAWLREKFSQQGSRYLAAYNMGSRNVQRLLASSVEPKIYSEKVLSVYEHFYMGLGRASSPVSLAASGN